MLETWYLTSCIKNIKYNFKENSKCFGEIFATRLNFQDYLKWIFLSSYFTESKPFFSDQDKLVGCCDELTQQLFTSANCAACTASCHSQAEFNYKIQQKYCW